MGFLLLVNALAHEGERGECKRDDDARENPEEAPPSPRVDEQATEQRPDIGCEPERDAGDAHGRRVLPGRKARHGDRLHDRQHDARADRLQHACREQYGKAGRKGRDQGADQHERQGGEDERAHRVTTCEMGNERNGDADDEHVYGGEPLADALGRAEARLDAAEHGVHGRLRQAAECGGQRDDSEHRVCAATVHGYLAMAPRSQRLPHESMRASSR